MNRLYLVRHGEGQDNVARQYSCKLVDNPLPWRKGLLQILAGKTGRNILLVAHARIFTATLKELCPEVDVTWLLNAECYNCSISELEIEVQGGEPRGKLVAWSSHAHLSGDAVRLVPGTPPRDAVAI